MDCLTTLAVKFPFFIKFCVAEWFHKKGFLVHEAQDIKDNKDRLFYHPGGDIILRDANSLPFMAE